MTPVDQTIILDFDVGNTRIKWRLSEGDQRSHGFLLTQNKGLEKGFSDFIVKPNRVRISSVVHGQQLQKLIDLCQSQWQVHAELAQVEAHCAGVTQAYAQREKLGVDRWLGMLAAYDQAGDCVLVSCGSAVTVDVLLDDGLHQGGYIVPGLQMMLNSLYQGTDAVKVEFAASLSDLSPGRDTQTAVNKGIVSMVKGLVDHASESYQAKTGAPPKILITGGDGETVQPFLGADSIYNPYLVLDGLALALP